jgi:hypothetical protein
MTDMTPTERAYAAALAIPGNIAEVVRLEHQVNAEQAAREARLNGPGALLGAALWYAGQGLLVFPCKPGQKVPATAHGFKDASNDTAQITEWWQHWPAANIGLPTGHQFDVLDIDGPKGSQSLNHLRELGLMEEPTIGRAKTPHGFHMYYRPSGDGNTTALAPGIDYRGQGGYVLAAPSRLADGGVYRWYEPLTLEGI